MCGDYLPLREAVAKPLVLSNGGVPGVCTVYLPGGIKVRTVKTDFVKVPNGRSNVSFVWFSTYFMVRLGFCL